MKSLWKRTHFEVLRPSSWKEDMAMTIEAFYNQVLPCLGVMAIMIGNYWGIILLFPILVSIHFESDRRKKKG